MAKNEISQIPQNLKYSAHAVKWEAIWLYEGTKAIVTWSVELLKFMVKYPFCSEYRQEINNQAVKIYDFVEKEWLNWVWNKVYEAIWKEMDRISKLPPEKQAQAIWEIAWNVISMLAVIKAGTTIATKLWKVWQAESLITRAEAVWNTARAEKVREIAWSLLASKNWLKAFDIILTWVAESILLKWLSVSYKATLGFLENKHMPNVTKIEFLEQEINKVKNMKWETPEENQILQKYIDELEAKKTELNKSIDVERQVKWLEKLWLPESFTRDLLESWLLRKEFFWWDLLRRFEALEKKWIDFNKMIDDIIKEIPTLSKEEALLIFSYTDNTFYRRLNDFLRWNKEVLDTLTHHNIEVSKKLALKLEQALEKMPNMEWELVYRWDDWEWWKWKVWKEIDLIAFTSVANNSNDTFLSEQKNILVIIQWKEWRVKDISKLAMFVNFAEQLWKTPTKSEWVILPNSVLEITWKNKVRIVWNDFDIDKIKLKQVK